MGKGKVMSIAEQRRMLGSKDEYEARFGKTGPPNKWKKIRDDSMLHGYTSDQLRQRYFNLQTKHNVHNLEDFDYWQQQTRNARRETVRATLDPVMSVAGMPKTVQDFMDREARQRAMFSTPGSPAREVDPEVVMKSDLELVSKVVSAPTLVSQDLFKYIGANTGVPFKKFLEYAKPYAQALLETQPIKEFNPSGRSQVLEDMETLRARFGPVFDRNRDLNAFGPPREVFSQRVESVNESDSEENCYFDENWHGENRFEEEDSSSEDVIEIEEVAVGVDTDKNEPVRPSQSSSAATQSVSVDVEVVMNEFVYPGLSSQSSSETLASLSPGSSPIALANSVGMRSSQVDVGASPKLQSSGPAQKKPRKYSEPVTPTVPRRQCYEFMEIPELPKGYAAMFPNRLLIDAEWRMVLETKRDFTRMNEEEWKSLLEKLKIQQVKTGKQIMDDFYCKLVPRIRDRVFGAPGKETKVCLGVQHRYAVVVIYHRIQGDDGEPTNAGARQCIQDLINAGILDDELTVKEWQLEFLRKLFTESCDYFCTGEKSFNDFLSALTD